MKRVATAMVIASMLSLSVSAAPEDPLLARITAGLSRPAVLRANFTQTKTVTALTRPLVTSGRLVYAHEHGILWKIERPYRLTYVLDDKGVAELDANGARRVQNSQGAGLQHVSRIFRALIEADLQALGQYFEPTAREQGRRWEIELAPRSVLRSVFKNVVVRGGRFVDEVSFAETNGDTMIIRFLDIQEALTLEGDEFAARRRE